MKAVNFQTKNFVSFVQGYIIQSIVNSLVNRLIVQSLMPMFLMQMAQKKRENSNVKLSNDEVNYK
jgi:hypothetical protein